MHVGATRLNHRNTRGLVGGIHAISGHVTVLVSAGKPRIHAAILTRPVPFGTNSHIGIMNGPRRRAAHRYVSMSCPRFIGSLGISNRVLVSSNSLRLIIMRGAPSCLLYRMRGRTALNDHGDIGIPNIHVGLPSLARGSHAGVLCTVRGGVSFVTRSFIHGGRSVLSVGTVLSTRGDSVHVITGVRGRRNISGVSRVLRMTSNIVVTHNSLNVRIPRRHVPNVRHILVHGYVLTGGPIVITARVLRAVVSGPHPAHTRMASVTGTVCCHASTLVLDNRATCKGCPMRTIGAVAGVTTRTRGSGLSSGSVHVPLSRGDGSIATFLTGRTMGTAAGLGVHTVVASDCDNHATHGLTTFHNGCPILTVYCGRGAVQRLTLSCNIRTVCVPRLTGKRRCCFTTLHHLLGRNHLYPASVINCLDDNGRNARASFLRVGIMRSTLGRTRSDILPGDGECL